MRDAIVALVVGLLTLVSAARPDIGVLAWTWVGTFNPHRLAWGFAKDLPVAMLIGGATVAGLLFYRRGMRLPKSAPVFALLAFDLWMVVTHFAGFYPFLAEPFAIRILKIQFMVFVALLLLNSRQHIEWLVWVLVLSLGFFGVKGGIFTLGSGGAYRVWGPDGTFIEGNNELALALIMVIPLMRYLHITHPNKWVKRAMLAAMPLSAAAALGSQSRGALLAMAAMVALLWLRGNKKLVGGALIAVATAALIAFMPSTWEERMGTIQTYTEDASAMQRINVWTMCWNIAKAHPIFGGGYAIYTRDLTVQYAPHPDLGLRNAHSIYFSVLGEHGFVGLALFLGVWFYTWRSASWIRRHTQPSGELAWAYWLSSMIQVSVVGYLVGGAFLYLAYFDLPYNLLILAAITQDCIRRHVTQGAAARPGQEVLSQSISGATTR